MARKPNYDFERREREKLKAEKAAQKAARKAKDAEEQGEGADAAAPDDGKAAASPAET